MNSTTSPNLNWEITTPQRAEIDALFANFTNATPGAAMAIYREGEVVYANGYGRAHLEYPLPIIPDSIFDIASISKQFTAMCVALLQQDGLLDVDDPVQKYFPELPEWEHPVTVRHLIHHVSGIRDYLGVLPLAGWRDEDQMTNADCLKYIALQKQLEFEPNTREEYSNSGYVLLASLVERVATVPMRQLAHERIFAPLGMTNSHFNDEHATVIPNRAQAYRLMPDGSYRIDIMPLDDLVGDGGLFTSVIDFGKWIANFTTCQVGGQDLLEMTQTPGTLKDGTPMEYAWGLGIDEFHGFHRVGHSGGWAGYGSNYFRLPELGFGVAIFANFHNVGPSDLTDRIAEIVLADIFSTQKTGSTPDDDAVSEINLRDVLVVEPSSLAGVYVQDNGESHLCVDDDNGQPFLSVYSQKLTLNQQDDGSFTQKWRHFVILPIDIDDDGQVSTLRVQMLVGEDRTEQIFNRVTPWGSVASDIAGNYYSDELDAVWEVALDDTGALMVVRPKHDADLYAPVAADYFGTGGLAMGVGIRFHRDDAGDVTGLTYGGRRFGTFTLTKVVQG
ncbi:MAG: beta-lactamase family protein [Thermomicrobiales bacterium]|nr:beta-lactamase family protein [Thermomicrobiales bacterium]